MSGIEITQADRDFAKNWNFECRHCSEYEGDVEADMAEAVARHEARAEALKDALTVIALLPTGTTEDVMEGHEQAYRAIEALCSDERKE